MRLRAAASTRWSSPSGRTILKRRCRAISRQRLTGSMFISGAGERAASKARTRPSMTETNEPIKIHRGLKGVYFDRSPCTFIDGKAGELRYRGYSIHDLAENSTFEETAWLLLNGELPNAQQLSAFDKDLKAARSLPEPIYEIIHVMKSAHPMDVLRTAVSALSAFDPDVAD